MGERLSEGLPVRHVFLEFPWVHKPAPAVFYRLFRREGRFVRLPAGCAIFNGGEDAEVGWILSGLAAYAFQDARDCRQIFTLVPEGRLMGNVDGFTGTVVNIIDSALRPMELLLIPRKRFMAALEADPELSQTYTRSLVAEHESDLEGAFSRSVDPVEMRVLRLYTALLLRDAPRSTFSITVPQSTAFTPVPIPYGLTVTETALVVGATRVRVSGVLRGWEKEGLVLKNARGERLLTPCLFLGLSDWLTSREGPRPPVRPSRRKT